MAVSMSQKTQTEIMFSGVMAHIFEEWDYSFKPVKYEMERDLYRMTEVGVLWFKGNFVVRVDIPSYAFIESPQFCVSAFKKALCGASVFFSDDEMHHLFARTGFHPVAVIGGYDHGNIIHFDISKPAVRIAATGGIMSGPPSGPPSASLVVVATTVIDYELAVFNGGGFPAYVLHPAGERPELDFILMSFQEFPLLGLLPASQGFIYTNTSFVTNGVACLPMRQTEWANR